MFGYIVINKGEMKFKEYDVYHSFYCGLCRKLKEKYGVLGQLSLTYDMTFLIMLLTGVYEPETDFGHCKCIAHPFVKHPTRTNEFTDYAADMNLILSCYKCKDDWEDDKKYGKLLYYKLLKKKCGRLVNQYGDKIKRISELLEELTIGENAKEANIDLMAGRFGEVMAEIMVYKKDEWEDNLHKLGFYLGKFIYLMDAYEDVEEDLKTGNYNPMMQFYDKPEFEEESKRILTMMVADCSKEFEKLPILENANILRNILYSGIWYRFEMVNEKRKHSYENRQKLK